MAEMARTSPLPLLVAHPRLLLLKPAILTACQSLQQHCLAPRTEGLAAGDPALFYPGLSKHQGFVSYLSLINLQSVQCLMGTQSLSQCDTEPFLSLRRQDSHWRTYSPDTSKANSAFSCCPLLPIPSPARPLVTMGTQVSFLPSPCSLWGFTKPCTSLSDPCGGMGNLPVGSNSCTGWPRIEGVSWHIWLPQEGCPSVYGASRCGHSSG